MLKKKGFSLVELIFILSIASSVAFLSFQSLIKQTPEILFEKIGSFVIDNSPENNFTSIRTFSEKSINGNVNIQKTSVSPSSLLDSGLKISITNATQLTCKMSYKIPKNTKLYFLTINGHKVISEQQLNETCNQFKDNIKIEQYIY